MSSKIDLNNTEISMVGGGVGSSNSSHETCNSRHLTWEQGLEIGGVVLAAHSVQQHGLSVAKGTIGFLAAHKPTWLGVRNVLSTRLLGIGAAIVALVGTGIFVGRNY